MKNVAIIAVILGTLGSSAFAESAVSEAPIMTLAMNSNAAVSWLKPAAATKNNALANQIELKMNQSMEQISVAMDKKLEDKIAKELEYAMH
jgi:hypothetical protein